MLLICYVDTDSVAALLMRLRLRQRSPSTKSMTTNPSVSQKNSVHYATPDPATTTAVFNSIVSTCRDCVSAQNAFVAMAELERLKKKKKNPGCNELSLLVNVFLVLKRERESDRERESPLAHRSVGDQLKD